MAFYGINQIIFYPYALTRALNDVKASMKWPARYPYVRETFVEMESKVLHFNVKIHIDYQLILMCRFLMY